MVEVSITLDSEDPEMRQFDIIQVEPVYYKGVIIPINVVIPTPDLKISFNINVR